MNDDLNALLAECFRSDGVRYLEDCLRLAARTKLKFDQMPRDDRRRAHAARDMLRVMVQGIGGLAGDKVVSAAYGDNPPQEASRELHLEALWFRLWPAVELFRPVDDPAARSSIRALQDEVLAVANGDEPKLLARVVSKAHGQGKSRYRLALKKIRALEWEKFLLSRGLPPGEVQSKIVAAFTNTPWSTIRSWRQQCEDALGENVAAYLLGLAASGWHSHFLPLMSEEEMWALLEADGRDFDKVRRENAAGPPRQPHKPRRSASRKIA